MTVDTVVDEVSLPAAVNLLHDSVSKLIDEQKSLIQGRILAGPSWWDRLVESVAGTSAMEANRLVPDSRPPCWSPAIDMTVAITAEVRSWLPGPDPVPVKLRALASRRWAPPEVQTVAMIGGRVAAMVADIKAMLEPAHIKSFAAACPNCGERWSRRLVDGEWVRSPVLNIVADVGCSCLACNSRWRPDQYTFLARLLGCEAPEGVTA